MRLHEISDAIKIAAILEGYDSLFEELLGELPITINNCLIQRDIIKTTQTLTELSKLKDLLDEIASKNFDKTDPEYESYLELLELIEKGMIKLKSSLY